MSRGFLEKVFSRRRWTDILTAKSAVMWSLLLAGELTVFSQEHERWMGVGWILTCLTTTAMVLLRIEHSNDAWRRGYKQAVVDVREVEEQQESAQMLPFRVR